MLDIDLQFNVFTKYHMNRTPVKYVKHTIV